MNARQLKNSILQRAIEGKLVEQREEEGTAAELLREIKAEKMRLVKEGKLKKEKSLRSITAEEIPFEIPESWEWVRLGEISTYGSNKLKISPRDITPEMWTLDMEDIEKESGRIIRREYAKNRTITGDKIIFRKGEILYSKLRPYLKKVLVAPADGICTSELVPFQCYADINAEYVTYYLRSPYVTKIVNVASYGVKMPRVNKETMIELPVPLPPLAEQKRIVAKIEELLPHVEQYGKAHDELTALNEKFPDAMKKSVLQYAMEGKLVEQREEEGTAKELLAEIDKHNSKLAPCKSELDYSAMDYDIPSTWELVELNRILHFVDYRGKTPHKSEKGIFLITASNIKKGYMDYTRKEYISREEYQTRQERGITKKGDLLFTTEAPMGNSAICDLDECSCGQRIITFQEYQQSTVNLSLMMYFILSPQFQQQLLDNCTGTTAKGIKAEKLKHFLIPLPPLAEQKRIVAKIEELLACCGALEKA